MLVGFFPGGRCTGASVTPSASSSSSWNSPGGSSLVEPAGGASIFTSSNGWVAIDVQDQGVGIAGADVPRLFQRFSQLQREDLSTPEGSGLGLYICRTMLEAQGGSIDVASEPGRGTTFTYRLPIAPADA